MEKGPREDGVEKRVREMREAEAAAIRQDEARHNELIGARDKLREAITAHIAQLTSNEVTMLELEDAPYSIEAVIHIENAEGLWHRAIFVAGVDSYPRGPIGTEITYFVATSEPHDLPTPQGSNPLHNLAGVGLAAAVTHAAAVAVEFMAREQFSGATILSDEESRAKDRERARLQTDKRPENHQPAAKQSGCNVAIWMFLVLMGFSALVSALKG